jgi:hypothetical protein
MVPYLKALIERLKSLYKNMKAVVLFALLGFALALDCEVYTCGDLEDGVCATISDDRNTVTFNENGCDDDQYCSLTGAILAFVDGTTDSYECQDGEIDDFDFDYDYDDLSGDEWKELPLCQADSDKDLKEGEWSDVCDSDDDCELVDGTFADCECHANGKAYCTPDLGSDYFEDWYTLCEDGDADFTAFTYYYYKASLYSLVGHLDDGFDCATDVIAEYDGWDEIESDFEDDDDSASSLVLGSLLALLFLA